MNRFTYPVSFLLGLILLSAVSPPSTIYAFSCLSTGTGQWHNAATWIDCNGTTPQSGDTAQIQNGHTVTLDTNITNIAITVDSGGILETSMPIDFGGSTVNVNGTFRLNSNVVLQNATFAYGSSSTLNYNSGLTHNRDLEWNSSNPHHVQLSGNTTFDLNATSPQTMSGNLLIEDGSTFVMGSTNEDLIVQGDVTIEGILELATGTGNMQVGGNWLKDPTPSSPPGLYKFKHNDSSVIFNGNQTQTITGAMNGTDDRFSYVVVTNNSDVIYHNKIGVEAGLQVDAGSSFMPFSNENFEQEINGNGTLSCAGTCVFNRLTVRQIDASSSTGSIDVNENFVIENPVTSFFIAPPAGTPFTIAGDFSSANTSGAINFNGGTVHFDGSTTQTMSLNGVTAFHNLIVGSGTVLVNAIGVEATASGTFINNGIFRRTQIIAVPGLLNFGLTNVSLNVNNVVGLPQITVDRIDGDHPGATAAIAANSDRYWAISDNAIGTFNVDVIFNDDTLTDNTMQRTCRTTDGVNWECVDDADPAPSVTRRNGVTAFSDWQNCGACGPTAVSFTHIYAATPRLSQWVLFTFFAILSLMIIQPGHKRIKAKWPK